MPNGVSNVPLLAKIAKDKISASRDLRGKAHFLTNASKQYAHIGQKEHRSVNVSNKKNGADTKNTISPISLSFVLVARPVVLVSLHRNTNSYSQRSSIAC